MMTIRAYPERGPYVSENCRCEFKREVWIFTGRLSGFPIVGIPNCQWERELVTKDSEPCPETEPVRMSTTDMLSATDHGHIYVSKCHGVRVERFEFQWDVRCTASGRPCPLPQTDDWEFIGQRLPTGTVIPAPGTFVGDPKHPTCDMCAHHLSGTCDSRVGMAKVKYCSAHSKAQQQVEVEPQCLEVPPDHVQFDSPVPEKDRSC